MDKELNTLHNLATVATTFVVEYGFQIIGALIILAAGVQIARWTSSLVRGLCERRSIDVTLAGFFANVTRVVVLAFVVVIALGKFGITIAPFIAALGAIAFGGSLAIQGPLSNYGAGIAIILGRPFVVGNTVTVRGVSGLVKEVHLAATVLGTEDGEEITIPNRRIVGEILQNSFACKVVEATLAVGYEDEPEAAIRLVAGALRAVDGVSAEPGPQVGIDAFGESGFVIGLRYWVPTERYFQTKYEANRAVYAVLREAGIHLAPPRRRIEVVQGATVVA